MTTNQDRHQTAAATTVARPTLFPIVGVGASAGGLEAFTELLRHIPIDSGIAFVLIQHLDPTHASYLSDALSRVTSLPVHEVEDGMQVEPNHVYVIPSDADVGILGGALALLPRPPTELRRPHLPIDFFLKALAAERANQAIGVILSGTGADGSEGLRAIKAEDGVTFVQEPRSAKFGGMPEAAIKAGVVDFTLPVRELAEELLRISNHPFVRARDHAILATPADEADLKKVLVLLRTAAGVDFCDYKLTTIRRRLARRMALLRLTELSEYVLRLRDDPEEAQVLVEDMLIHVTSLFRDGAAFEALKERAFPEVLRQKRTAGTIRLWSAGCSTGEEAYSLVIALLEFLAAENASDVPVQLFGTDVSERAIERARSGFFSDGAVRDVSAERLARFFTPVEGGGYRINKAVRDRCAFVKHDLTSDPPYSKLDLVSCRNVLIYFGPDLQQRVISTFHFALNQPGFLLLGHAENIADRTQLFSVIEKDTKIFARIEGKSTLQFAPAKNRPLTLPSVEALRPPRLEDIVRRAETQLLDQYAPPGVIVNERMEIVHFRGRTGAYLEAPSGQPQNDLLKMARPGLAADLRIAISQAEKTGTTVRRSGVRVEQNGSTRECDVVVFPLTPAPGSSGRLYAVMFEEHRLPAPPSEHDGSESRAASEAGGLEPASVSLASELEATKEYLHSLIQSHQDTNEELMSANEELVSSNEELQSLNEELETAKEELQSTNEELSTLNEELQTRNVELNSVNSDLFNILGSVEVPIVIVDGQRRIRRFTPKARPILNLLPSDVGRPIDDIKPALDIDDLDAKIAEVIDTVAPREEEVRGRDGSWYRLRIRPYTTVDKRIDGAVISVIDIDALKRALGAAEIARDYAKATVEAVQTPLLVLDEDCAIVSANEAFYERFGLHNAHAEGRSVYTVQGGAWDSSELREELARVIERDQSFQKIDQVRTIPGLGIRSVLLSARAVKTPTGERLILLAVEDVTERKRVDTEREQLLAAANAAKAGAEKANQTKDLFLATLSHELRTPLSSLLLQAQYIVMTTEEGSDLRRSGEAIERATRTQAQLIDDLLDISRIVTGKLRMDLQMVDLADVVRSAAETVTSVAEHRQVALEFRLDESLPPVSGDPTRLQQVVWNLLSNAIKFTPKHGRVVVTLDSAEGRGRIRVSDNGVGIQPNFLPEVFNRFSQENQAHTRMHGGLGLGLGIVRYVVEAHGGTVAAYSEGKGKGSTFTVLLPLVKAHTAAIERLASQQGGAANIQGVRVLIVEDDPGTREALTEMLTLNRAVVRSFASAAEALAKFDEFRPDLLVCDIAMPDEDGYRLLGRIRALGPERGGDVPALALTALATEDDRRRAFEAGFQMHMAKPVDIDRLIAALAELGTRLRVQAGPEAAPPTGP